MSAPGNTFTTTTVFGSKRLPEVPPTRCGTGNKER